MSLVWIALGWLVWLSTLFASGMINFLAGYHLGRSATEAQVFGVLGASADIWKAVGPIFIVVLWRNQRRALSVIAASTWIACFIFAVTSALGLAALNRSALTGNREALRMSYTSVAEELETLERSRERLGPVPSVTEVEAEISAMLATPIGSYGTVGTLSENCAKDHWRARRLCSDVAQQRARLASVAEVSRLDARIEKARSDLAVLRERGGTLETDPQADLISRLTFGLIARADVGLGVVVLMAVMVELISAFAPVILYEAFKISRATATTIDPVADRRGSSRLRRSERGREDSDDRWAHVYNYLLQRIAPDVTATVEFGRIFDDYALWCDERAISKLCDSGLLAALSKIVERDMGDRVRVEGSRFFGFRLASEESANFS